VSETAAISDIVPKDRCEDTSIYCAEWAGEGECETNPMFMMKNCTKTCGVCAAGIPSRRYYTTCVYKFYNEINTSVV